MTLKRDIHQACGNQTAVLYFELKPRVCDYLTRKKEQLRAIYFPPKSTAFFVETDLFF